MSVVPVLTGAALAWTETGRFVLVPVLAALIGAFAIQIGTNLLNDVSDGESGLDRPARLGPPRVTTEGWASAAQVKAAALLAFATAAFAGLVLVVVGGLPILAIGIAALVAGWAYSRGPAPIAAGPLGELFVLIFFGVVAVGGTYCLLADRPSWTMLFAGILVGLPAAAVLLVNNHRDRFDDLRAGRRTLAIRLGLRATRRLYAVFIAGTLALASAMALVDARPELALPLAAAPTAWRLIQEMKDARIDSGLNLLLGRTAGFQAMVAGLFALGLVISA
jgi:1,4-dihydroxy-2-naphthoate octaprenyltransferase